MTAYENILAALRDHGTVNANGQTAMAQCPAHNDRTPSLSVTATESRVLVHCHAGCATGDVMAALGLTKADLFNEPRGDTWATYPYPGGRRVHRKRDKKFAQSGNTKDRSLFHVERIGDAQTVHAVEGEEDVYAVESVGGVAVCSAMGAGKAHLADWTPLDGRHVVIVADKDEPGRKHAVQVAAQCGGAASIRIVEAAIGKDISDHIAAGKTLDELVSPQPEGVEDDNQTVPTVPWPTLDDAALHGTAGKIVNLVAPHTEADPAAILVHLLAIFGATVGPEPHFVAANSRHQAIVNPLIVGRTTNGAKGTALSVVEAIRKQALSWFNDFTASGLSTAEGLIEMVRDPSGEGKDFDEGVSDKRLLIVEPEYASVLTRMRREGNTLGQTLRDAFDCRDLRTLTRKHNKLTATGPHIVVVGHITPGEFRATLKDSDLSGGSVNRLLICLSRRSRLHSRLGNISAAILAEAANLFSDAYAEAARRCEMKFTDRFWKRWDDAYAELNRDRPDTRSTAATARAVTQVLRCSLIYALMDKAEEIDVVHLDAALALWAYAEHSARWLFSTYELEAERESAGGLAEFIRDGGRDGRTRTEIYRDHFQGHVKAGEITAQLTPLVHDGVVVEVKEETGARPITRYVHRDVRICGFADYAGQDDRTIRTVRIQAHQNTQNTQTCALPKHPLTRIIRVIRKYAPPDTTPGAPAASASINRHRATSAEPRPANERRRLQPSRRPLHGALQLQPRPGRPHQTVGAVICPQLRTEHPRLDRQRRLGARPGRHAAPPGSHRHRHRPAKTTAHRQQRRRPRLGAGRVSSCRPRPTRHRLPHAVQSASPRRGRRHCDDAGVEPCPTRDHRER